MLRFLMQTTAAHSDLDAGEAPDGLLHPQEEARLERLRVWKRRRDWLLGRWTAKHLVQQHLLDATGISYPLGDILILADPDGAPYAALRGSIGKNDESYRLHLSLSISHSGDRALCALTDVPGAAVGVDIELIEAREPGLPDQFFTAAEADLLAGAPPELHDTAFTAIWCAKEAVLKALRTGLRSDTRWLTCLPAQVADRPVAWTAFTTSLDERLLAQAPMGIAEASWRVLDAYIAAYAVATPLPPAAALPPA